MSKDLRGSGSVYRQKYANGEHGAIWWIAYRARGVKSDGSIGSILFRESSKSTERSVALKLLKQRVGEASGVKRVIGAAAERVTLGEMFDAVIKRYLADGKLGSLRMVRRAKLHLVAHFGEHAKAIAITNERLDEYKQARSQSFITRSQESVDCAARVKVHPKPATINRELACLRIAFNLMLEANRLTRDHVPVFRLFAENNARQGFVEPEAFERLHDALPTDLRDPVRFLYLTSWRIGVMQSLEWRDVELEFDAKREITGGRIHVRAENDKTGHAQMLPLNVSEELLEIIKRAHAQRDPALRFVFHRNGRKILSFRKTWRAACKAVGMTGLFVHDLRRSGVRNLVRAGVPERIAMGVSGHRTRSVFDRYNIVSEADLSAAMTSVSNYNQARAATQPKVVPIRKMAKL